MKNPFGITTKKCTKIDYSFVYGLTKKSLSPYTTKYTKINKKEFDEDFNRRYREILILLKNKKRIGFYHVSKDIYESAALYIVRIFISPSYQKKGIGSFLMDYFETLGYKKIRLQILSNNPAFHFYKKHGYKIIHKRQGKYLLEKTI